MPNERNWSATELECAAIVWAIKKNRQLFYGIPFVVVSDQPLENLEILSTKVNRVQRWFDFLSADTYTLEHRPGKIMAIQICCHVCLCLPQKQITTLMFDCLVQKILMCI